MRRYVLFCSVLFLVGCASTQPPSVVEVPVAVRAKPVTVKPLGALPLSKINDKSTAGELVSACFQSVHKLQDYAAYLRANGNFAQ